MPDRLVVMVGTGTGVGKTWVGAGLISRLRAGGRRVAARKPAQSFDPDDAGSTDADILAAASGEAPFDVCPVHRWYPWPMAPAMAAQVLGQPRLVLSQLIDELAWPDGVDVGVIEGAGGVRSPLAEDGDVVDLISAVSPDRVVLVAGPGLGTLNLVRMSLDALAGWPVTVHLNRLDDADELHRRNRAWIEQRLEAEVTATLAGLADRITRH